MNLLSIIVNAAIEAGKEILKIYHTDFDVAYKNDQSPLTLADKNAHNIIVRFLSETGIPVLSEEGRDIPYEERKNWKRLWIVDPLDGTKEFVKKNGEFTVNIALIENGTPVLGVVYAPVPDELYAGDKQLGAFKIEQASKCDVLSKLNPENKLPLPSFLKKEYYGVVASRSHMNKETEDFIDKLKTEHRNIQIVSKGSSLKLCMVAEGAADIYPRFAPTSEWDTAAADAVVRAAGAKTLNALTRQPLVYNKKDILNPWFVVKRE